MVGTLAATTLALLTGDEAAARAVNAGWSAAEKREAIRVALSAYDDCRSGVLSCDEATALFSDLARSIVEELAAHGLTHPIRIRKVEDRVAGGSKLNTLVARRKEPGSPVEVIENLSAGGSLADRGHYHERWKIVVHGSQAIAEPGAHGRSAG